jgi:hypothetical protein
VIIAMHPTLYTTAITHRSLSVQNVNPNQEETMKNIYKALKEFQKNELKAKKNQNSHFGSYADLESVWQTIRKPLTENGLSISQSIILIDNVQCLETVLQHESGEDLKSVMKLDFQVRNVQALGALITYARRYSICALLGIVSDPDLDSTQKIETCEFTKDEPKLTHHQIEILKSLCVESSWEQGLLGHLGLKSLSDVKQSRFEACKGMLMAKAKQKEKNEN